MIHYAFPASLQLAAILFPECRAIRRKGEPIDLAFIAKACRFNRNWHRFELARFYFQSCMERAIGHGRGNAAKRRAELLQSQFEARCDDDAADFTD